MDSIDHLRQSVEQLHKCRATHEASVLVTEIFQDQTAWEGTVHSFTLQGNSKATRCYAWSSPIEESENRKVYAVLELSPVNSAADAVRASIVAEHKSGGLGA